MRELGPYLAERLDGGADREAVLSLGTHALS
jgi:hypothetical protein